MKLWQETMRSVVPSNRLFALGSPHGDDQVAWRLVSQLSGDLPEGWQVFSLGQPVEMLHHLGGCSRVLVLDAISSGRAPGTIARLDWPDPHIASWPGCATTHQWDLVFVLQLGAALGRLPASVVIMGIEIAETGPVAELDPVLERALPGLRCRVLCEMRGGEAMP